MQTDRNIRNNERDITTRDTEKGISPILEIAVWLRKKILKHKDLITEIWRMWNVKAKVIPVIKGATGTVSESLRQYLRNVPGKHEIKKKQKTAILDTAHKVWVVLV